MFLVGNVTHFNSMAISQAVLGRVECVHTCACTHTHTYAQEYYIKEAPYVCDYN